MLLLLLLPLQNEVGTRETREGWGNCRRPRSTVVGEVRWQSINIQNRRRARETEGGRASERANERRPTERERQKHRERKREGEVEGGRGRGKEREASRCLRPFVRSFLRPQSPTDLNPERGRRKSDATKERPRQVVHED